MASSRKPDTISDFDDPEETVWVVADLPASPGWSAALRVDTRTGRPRVVEARFMPATAGGSVLPEHCRECGGLKSPPSPELGEVSALMLREARFGDLRRRALERLTPAVTAFLFRRMTKRRFDSALRSGGRDLRFLASVAAEVEQAWSRGSLKPRAVVAERRGMSDKHLRDMLEAARKHGLLNRPGMGRTDYALTERGRALLGRMD